MKKVMIFGVFDGIEDRHQKLLEQAVEHGDRVMVVMSRDEGDDFSENEYQRMTDLMSLSVVDDVVLMHGDHVEVIRTHTPDVILIGEHQEKLTDDIAQAIEICDEHQCALVYATR